MVVITILALLLATFFLTAVINIPIGLIVMQFMDDNTSFMISFPLSLAITCYLLRNSWKTVYKDMVGANDAALPTDQPDSEPDE